MANTTVHVGDRMRSCTSGMIFEVRYIYDNLVLLVSEDKSRSILIDVQIVTSFYNNVG